MAEKIKLLAVIRVRGTVKVRQSIVETLTRLNLKHVNNLVLLTATPDYLGMVKKSKDFVTFGEISEDVLSKLFEKKEIKAKEADIKALISGEKTVKDLEIEMPIRMHPPRHGYEGIKKGYGQGGALGNRGEDINKLISRML
ncbi:50S ribosomal protein L30 [uncultured archaeon]|nr:50S ribosomal protein L30 [uncultured archaeon]